jgi:TonB family protein
MTRLVAPKDKAPTDLTRLGYRAPAPDGFTMLGYEALVRVSTIDPSKFKVPSEFEDAVHSNHTSVRLCIDGSGSVTRADVVESSLIAAYDEQILANVRTWRYQPYVLDGAATPVCTTVRIKFAMPPMAEPPLSGR